ncbi:aspartate/glutamate racemase family protein [Bacillus sp. SCS-153A]|uniref:aspartate/glutamate racemase family protein n=1 Tax=Rossellomorea sedimentorum TaxID=3115294 RepID=UPI003905CAEA
MKMIGMIGGMSWESSAEYYRFINQQVKNQMGGLHSAKCMLYSVDFEEIQRFQSNGEWVKAGNVLGDAAHSLETAGADFIILCTNTMHKVIEQISERVSIPVLHIADAAAVPIVAKGIKSVGLLGTKYTMEQDFYKERLRLKGIHVIIPDACERERVNSIIFEELCVGRIEEGSREYMKRIINSLQRRGAEGIVLGCTEIGLLIKEKDSQIPVFDTAFIHAEEAVKKALKDD